MCKWGTDFLNGFQDEQVVQARGNQRVCVCVCEIVPENKRRVLKVVSHRLILGVCSTVQICLGCCLLSSVCIGYKFNGRWSKIAIISKREGRMFFQVLSHHLHFIRLQSFFVIHHQMFTTSSSYLSIAAAGWYEFLIILVWPVCNIVEGTTFRKFRIITIE